MVFMLLGSIYSEGALPHSRAVVLNGRHFGPNFTLHGHVALMMFSLAVIFVKSVVLMLVENLYHEFIV